MANALSEILLYSCIAAFVTGSAAFSASSRLFDLNGETDRVSKRQKSAIIAVDVRRFGHAINTDKVFGTHTCAIRSQTCPFAHSSSTITRLRQKTLQECQRHSRPLLANSV